MRNTRVQSSQSTATSSPPKASYTAFCAVLDTQPLLLFLQAHKDCITAREPESILKFQERVLNPLFPPLLIFITFLEPNIPLFIPETEHTFAEVLVLYVHGVTGPAEAGSATEPLQGQPDPGPAQRHCSRTALAWGRGWHWASPSLGAGWKGRLVGVDSAQLPAWRP